MDERNCFSDYTKERFQRPTRNSSTSLFKRDNGVIFWHVVKSNEVNHLKKGILLAIGALAFLAGCGNQGNKASSIPVEPKWKGAPYRITLDVQAAKPNQEGVTIPVIKYTANPELIEKRVVLVVRFDASSATKSEPTMNKMIMSPVDISGADGALPADYIGMADKDLSRFLAAYCIKGKIKIEVALARSSLSNQAGDAEVDDKRLSDWVPIEVLFKNSHPKC